MSAVLDGEIVCLEPDGRSNFYKLLFRRDWPSFVAFDLLAVDGEDLRDRPLLERKRRLKALMPRIDSRLVYMDHVRGRGIDLSLRRACGTSRASSGSGRRIRMRPMASGRRG
jgi:bifunctional non-homologous end joining protein LigD